MALSIPKEMYGETIVAITYIVVLFSIIVQGLTIGIFAKKLVK
jgi:CPA1 family monovalent cation:H+ antiporter